MSVPVIGGCHVRPSREVVTSRETRCDPECEQQDQHGKRFSHVSPPTQTSERPEYAAGLTSLRAHCLIKLGISDRRKPELTLHSCSECPHYNAASEASAWLARTHWLAPKLPVPGFIGSSRNVIRRPLLFLFKFGRQGRDTHKDFDHHRLAILQRRPEPPPAERCHGCLINRIEKALNDSQIFNGPILSDDSVQDYHLSVRAL